MAMGTRKQRERQEDLWVAHTELATAPGHPFYERVDDGLMASTRTTVEMLKKHGFEPVFIESPGAHSWFNWRNYLIEFAPQLF
jgi:enterochelin esterase-like enzyme